MTREATLAVASEAITRVAGSLPHATRVAVDGIDGSGKTILGDELCSRLARDGGQCVRASIDDFRWPGHGERTARRDFTPESYYETSYDYDALAHRLLQPLGEGGRHQVLVAKWDVAADRAAERVVEVGADAIVIVDGIFLQRPELRGLWDFRIWIDVDRDLALQRSLERDRAWSNDVEILDRYLNRNFPAHDIYITREDPRAVADLIIDNSDPNDPHITFVGDDRQ